MDKGHWIFPHDFNVEDWYGFVYRIVELSTGREYIGRKQFNNTTRRKVAGRKNRKKVVKESNWKEYTSSSKRLNEEMEKKGKDNYRFEIIELCKTKGELTYREVEIQWEEKVLSATLPDGSPKYYNGNIGAVKFRLDKHNLQTIQKFQGNQNAKGAVRSPATRKKMSNAKKGVPKSESHKKKLSEANKGKTLSEETKNKISKGNKSKVVSKETKEKMRESAKGRVISDEQKQKISLNNKSSKRCEIDGVEYKSIAEAARQLNLTQDQVRGRIKSANFEGYKFI